ncbi:MAG: hypothetical protein SFX18_02350 [Pirellulales bacterium]|nr:hypothetical protein [Pirellulales bacterium]
MFRQKLLQLGCAAVVAVGALFASQANVQAGAPCHYKKVVSYVTKQVPYEARMVGYDHCGQPYHYYATKYRAERVAVVQWVKVCY